MDPAATRLIFVTVAALDAEGCCRKLSGLLHHSMFGQWIYVFFRREHPQLFNRQTILESRGPYQRNGASLTLMRCVVLEIRLFLIHVLQKYSFLYNKARMKAEKQLYLIAVIILQ